MVSDKPAIAENKNSRNFSVSASLIAKHCLFLTWKKWRHQIWRISIMDQITIAKFKIHLHHSIIIDKLWLKITDCYFSWKFP